VNGDAFSDEKQLSGEVERVTFRKEGSGWSVLRVKVAKMRELQTVTGYSNAQAGQLITCEGAWKVEPSFGRQFAAISIVSTLPSSEEGLIKFLGGGSIPGMGPGIAKKIVKHFGFGAKAILDEDPGRLVEVGGVGEKKAQKIAAGWAEHKDISEIMIFLRTHDITQGLCRKIYKRYEKQAIEVIRADPYRLALEVSGIGFKSSDSIAATMGVPKDSLQRIRAGLVFLMQQAARGGHCGQKRKDLLMAARESLGIPLDAIEAGLDHDLALGLQKTDDSARRSMLVQHDDVVYLTSLASAEENIARLLKLQSAGTPVWLSNPNRQFDAEKLLSAAEAELRVSLASQQRAAVLMGLRSKVSILTGGPGTGKTTTLKTLLHILRSRDVTIALAAPTGKAAKRASETTGLDSSTIHRLLGLKEGGRIDGKVEADVVVLDETSMLDVPLTNMVLRALSPNTALILVGDVDQLPSVGPGQVLADIITSNALPVTRLTKVFRQAAGSLIIRNAHRINHGEMPEKGQPADDFFMMGPSGKDEAGNVLLPDVYGKRVVDMISDLVADRLPKRYGFDAIRDIQILCPMNRSSTGVFNMNAVLQKRLNPNPSGFLDRYGTRYGVGDKVIQTKNNYDLGIFNGDMGLIQSIDLDEEIVLVSFEGGAVPIPFDCLDELRLAFAMTIHKSQGSEAPCVIIPMTTQHYVMLQRNLLYTGITRARQLVVLVGQTKAIAMAVANDGAMQRITRLRYLLAEAA
jgi:exodeoxyribonuclease V alpha subunit